MQSVLEDAVRSFVKEDHIKNVLAGAWVRLHDEHGQVLRGIRGRMGAASMSMSDHEIGVDLIEMEPGSAFPLHTHPGDHILYILEGLGIIKVNEKQHIVREGDTVFIPAEHAHGVSTKAGENTIFRFLAFGHPHKHISAKDRMTIVEKDAPTQEESGR